MEKNDNPYITFGAQMGDIEADNAVAPHLVELSKLLVRFCNKHYCVEVDEIAPVLRVDGDLWCFGFEGCEKLRLSKKSRYITVDIGMPISRWKGINGYDIRKYLINNLREAVKLMVKRLNKENFTVNEKELWTDFNKVEKEFFLN
ncbi:hypothetical protein SAMN05443252_10430 [Bacillus sp. OV322]|uniref:hypothetical protein n=1 Tax=Bacillus sp. OV322 TaxID=1882764 RepID=UPI0008E5C310|nr:hypothetical protein [Bacillus sp. OV322]SFC51203.1 hypothetical protein SAMN05443252_10430 [Bacillus sp. OV322]